MLETNTVPIIIVRLEYTFPILFIVIPLEVRLNYCSLLNKQASRDLFRICTMALLTYN